MTRSILTSDEWKVLAKTLKTAYTNQNFLSDDGSIQVWYSMLRGFSYKALSDAIAQHIQTSKFPPTIAEIRALATEGEEPKALPAPKISKEMQEYFDKIHRWWDEMDAQIAEQNLEKEMGIYEARL